MSILYFIIYILDIYIYGLSILYYYIYCQTSKSIDDPLLEIR